MKDRFDQLLESGKETHSASVVVRNNHEALIEWVDDEGWRPLELMSVTKMIVGMVLGATIGDQGVSVLDEPLVRWFSEWNGSDKAAITLRHVVTHQSGLEPLQPVVVYETSDTVKLAVESELLTEPGTTTFYNNSAVQLLAGLVHRATGQSLDAAADESLFRAMAFGDWRWQKDDAGNPLCMAGLNARGDDVGRLAALFLSGGVNEGRQLISRDWIEATYRSGDQPHIGILCFPRYCSLLRFFSSDLISRWIDAGVPRDLVERARPMADIKVGEDEFLEMLDIHLGQEWGRLRSESQQRGVPAMESETGEVIGFGHDGDLGQHLVLLPHKGVVGLRQRDLATRELPRCAWSTFPSDLWKAV